MNFELFLTSEENFENIHSSSNEHIYTFIYKHKKTTLCDWSINCDAVLQAVEASRDLVVKSDALLTLNFCISDVQSYL